MKKVKKNNKGFSLVELIVVIAIMAVLMGVLAPQFLRYVERSRLQKDNSAIAEIANAMKIAMANDNINAELPVTVTITCAANNDATIDFTQDDADSAVTNAGGDAVNMRTELRAVIGDNFTTESNTYRVSGTAIVLQITTAGITQATGGFIEGVGGTAGAHTF